MQARTDGLVTVRAPEPAAGVVVAGEVVGWVDYDADRAVLLLLEHLAVETDVRTATLLIHRTNLRSLALAARAGFERATDLGECHFFVRPILRGC